MDNSLSYFIENDLKTRILSGRDIPESLSLMDLSSYYGVSITPVREAIGTLVDQHFIDRLPNRRLRINESKIGVGSHEVQVEQPRVPEDWGELLLDEVMLASLSRRAVYLRESLLAEKYQVGRSIIRQTFSRFAGAGLLEHVPRKGWLVHPLNQTDVEAYLEIREVLELRAVDLARDDIVDSDLEHILERESHALNDSLHAYLVERSGNRYIRDFFQQYVSRYYSKLFYYAAPEVSIVDEMTSQHQFILRAMLNRDWDRVRDSLAAHIRVQKVVLEKLLTAEHHSGG